MQQKNILQRQTDRLHFNEVRLNYVLTLSFSLCLVLTCRFVRQKPSKLKHEEPRLKFNCFMFWLKRQTGFNESLSLFCVMSLKQ